MRTVRIDETDCLDLLSQTRVAHLATVGQDGRPHIVPVTFALAGHTLVSVIDHKPKRTTDLQRLRNIAGNPHVAVLVDYYDDDWTQLWWVRVDGVAHVADLIPSDQMNALQEKYPLYRSNPPQGSMIEVTIDRLSGWSATTHKDQ
jgi:PPOX class probable F420-dependent enzyme